ncbi:hypothetical protein KZ813_00740 [Sphingomonas sp. RHCKR7]|uniref:hypothetical protein n=1 Tax=Sphingomonas folli TaxID=2862497 RepID=UPI001CA5637D|nr:hypothetical protein [Sphingomonas folli]MBW6525360.1 hypothetical protein [Sphingomonas folli]
MTRAYGALALLLLATVVPARAANRLVDPGRPVAVARSTLAVTPEREWNELRRGPGPRCDRWTLDGEGLNAVTFCGAIEGGRPIFYEVSKHDRPLPHFATTMLLTDLPDLIEQSYRLALGASLMTIDSVEPAQLGGERAIRFRYSFTRQDEELERHGEAIATIRGKKLYWMSYEAPSIFYYARDLESWRRLTASARFR